MMMLGVAISLSLRDAITRSDTEKHRVSLRCFDTLDVDVSLAIIYSTAGTNFIFFA